MRHDQRPGSAEPNPTKAVGRWIGALFLAAFGLYGVGFLLIERVAGEGASVDEILASQLQLRVGAMLVVLNSVAVFVIGVLMYRLTTKSVDRHVRLAYLSSRVFESVFLALGVVFALPLIAAAETASDDLVGVLTTAGDVAYQIGMIGLCVGSIPLFLALTKSGALSRPLGLWGVAGYAIFATGAALEILGAPVGVMLSVPGGLFEVIFAVYLLRKGSLRPVDITRRPHELSVDSHALASGWNETVAP